MGVQGWIQRALSSLGVAAWVGGWLLLGVSACDSRPTKSQTSPPSVVSERQATTGTSTAAHLELGEDCTTGHSRACRTSICIKTGLIRGGRDFFCTKECRTEDDCPGNGWLCHQVLPGPRGMLCIPPESWASQAVGVRP